MSNKAYPYIPNSAPQIKKEMMEFVNVKDEMELYEEIPEHLRYQGLLDLPSALGDEQSVRRHVNRILAKNKTADVPITILLPSAMRLPEEENSYLAMVKEHTVTMARTRSFSKHRL